MIRYFLYARKSTDDEERQVLSIDAQLTELREFATKENLVVIEEFIESRTAKIPGRPIFNAIIERIQNGEAQGLLAWHPDRLARNSVDGGLIVYLLDTGQLQSLKCPTFWFENTPQGKFMLNIAFGQSKYYVDNLQQNVLRGIRQKLRRGEYPGLAPIGYLNDPRTRTIVLDGERAPLVQKIFEAYATGNCTVADLHKIATVWGLRNRYGKPLARSQMWKLLKNPFYVGLMRVKGELYEASHDPFISKELFENVQSLLKQRSKLPYQKQPPFPFTKLLWCAECGGMITAERQKGHHYYRCTKKRGLCSQPYVREELLAEELRGIVNQLVLPESWQAPICKRLTVWEHEETQQAKQTRTTLETKLAEINWKLERLLDAHLDNTISREEYLPRKETLLHHKAKLQEQISKAGSGVSLWLEPCKQFFDTLFQANSIASSKNPAEIATFLKTVGSNLTLDAGRPHCEWVLPYRIAAEYLRNLKWSGATRCRSNLFPGFALLAIAPGAWFLLHTGAVSASAREPQAYVGIHFPC